MGCECSKEEKALNQLKASFIVEDKPEKKEESSPLLPEEKATFKRISLAINAIKKNDIFLMNKMLKQVQDGNLKLMADVYQKFLDYAVRKNAYTSMELLLSYLKVHSPKEYKTLIHSQDEEGRTLAMLCVLNESAETLYILFKHCEKLDCVSDKEGNTLASLCKRYSKGCDIVYQRMTDPKKKFLSLKEVINALQRVKRMKTTINQIILAKRAIDKLKSATSMRKDQTLPTEADKTLIDKTHSLIRKKTTRDFTREVIWCKRRRTPGFDQKFARGFKKRVDSLGNSFLSLGSHDGGATFQQENNDYFKNKTNRTTFRKDHDSDSGNDSEEYFEDEDDLAASNIKVHDEANTFAGEDENEVFLFQRLAFLKTLKKQNHEPPENSHTSYLLHRLHMDQNFEDTDFPAGNEIIGREWIHKNNNIQIIWQRPQELFQTGFDNIHLFDTIDPDDIEQGLLGVCYFLAAISAVAEFPSRVQRLFLNSRANQKGVYGLQFYSQGVPVEITVDDYIPCAIQGPNNTLKPIFSRPRGNELWVLLVEKAWAKLFGSYSMVEIGISDEAFEYILGVPSFLYLIEHQSTDRVWKRIYSADKKNYIISASTQSDLDKSLGLAPSHTYSVISAHEVSGYRILKLRNPWARFEWKGDFSDHSPLWTPRIMQEVGYVNAEDGVFAMTVEDFQQYFMGYVIAEYNEDWSYTYITGGNEPHHSEYFKFQITCPTEVYFRLHQRNERFKDIEGYAPADFRIAKIKEDGTFQPLVIKSGDIDDTAIYGHHSITPTRHHKLFLKKAGEYVVRVKMHWPNNRKGNFTLSAYSYHKIEFKQMRPIKDFLEKSFINIGRRAKHVEEFDNDCYIVRGFSGFNHYIYAKNEGNTTWTLTINFPNLQNAKLGKPHKLENQNTFQMVLQPHQEKAAYLKIIDPKTFESYIDPVFDNKWNK